MGYLDILLDQATEFISCSTGHHDVRNHYIDSLLLDHLICSIRIETAENIIMREKKFSKIMDDIRIIIYNQYLLTVLTGNRHRRSRCIISTSGSENTVSFRRSQLKLFCVCI